MMTEKSGLAQSWYDLFATSTTILLASPMNPDGDSVGAQLAMRGLIRAHFPKVTVHMYHEQELAPRYTCLPGHADFLHKALLDRVDFQKLDVLIVMDGGHDRIGQALVAKLHPHTKITQVDHHAVDGGFPYALRWWHPHASSTGEMVYRLLSTPPFDERKLSSDMAQAIYVSLIFDTGFFRHDSTTAETMKIATKLYEKNIPFTKLAEQTMLVMSFPAKKLLARTLSNMKIECGGRVAIATLSNRDLKECGAEEDDKEGLIDHVFLTPGVEVGALVLGLDAKVSKVSFRSRTDFDVAQFARSIAPKGGGHRKAAGCTLDMDAAAAEKHVLKNLVESFS